MEDYVKEKPDFQIKYGANPQINRQVLVSVWPIGSTSHNAQAIFFL